MNNVSKCLILKPLFIDNRFHYLNIITCHSPLLIWTFADVTLHFLDSLESANLFYFLLEMCKVLMSFFPYMKLSLALIRNFHYLVQVLVWSPLGIKRLSKDCYNKWYFGRCPFFHFILLRSTSRLGDTIFTSSTS